MSRRIFVIRDFEIKGIDISLEDLRRAPPEGYDEVIIPGLSGGRTQGQIFDDAVRRELMRATHVLAFVDLPNANVGFEIGYALGLGKAVALARVAGALPAWLTEPPLAGYLAPAARSAEQFRHLILSDHWIEMPVRPTLGQDVLFMCPESGEGASLHGSRRRLRPDWKLLPSAGWSLPDLKSKLDGVGRLVWCLVPFAKDTDERDGRENAADAIVAGFASACGLELRVWRHAQARPVADLQQWEHRFSRLDEFEALLTRPAAEVKAVHPANDEDPLPEVPSPSRTGSRWRPSARLAASVAAACVMLVLAWFASSSQPALRFAAERGVAAAQFQLALKLQEGRGGVANAAQEAEALEWLRLAAEASHVPALMRLGDLHERGVGVPRDVSRAREYFHRAAELGLFEARLREAALLGKRLGGDGVQPPAGVASATRPGAATPVAGASAPAVKDRRWPNGSTLTVAFVGGKAQDRETVKRHAKQWSSYANIDFDFVAPGGKADVRIAFDPSLGRTLTMTRT